MTEMMHTVIRHQLDMPNPDVVNNIESHCYDVVVEADSCEYELDMGKNLWLNKGRWSRLIKEYVPQKSVELMISQSSEIIRGGARQGATTVMSFREPDRYSHKHRWGGCLIGCTFRGDNKRDRATLTFYSRTTYIGYMGLLDAAIGHVLASQIDDPSNISFRWVISSSQLHCFKTLPFVFSQPDLFDRLEKYAQAVRRPHARKTMPPTWFYTAKWHVKILEAYAAYGQDMLLVEKYGPFKRIKRRWMEHMGILTTRIPPSLPVSTLDFEKAI